MKKLLVLALLLAFVGAVQADTLVYTQWGASGGVREYNLATNTAGTSWTMSAMDVAVNNAGNLLVVNSGTNKVEEWTMSGTQVSTNACGTYAFSTPQGIAYGTANGSIYVAVNGAKRFAKYNADYASMGWVGPLYDNWSSTQAGFTNSYPFDMAVNNATGDIYATVMDQVPGYNTGVILKTSVSDWGSTVTQSVFFTPPTVTDLIGGVAVDGSGNVWVADQTSDKVFKLNSAGQITLTVTVPTGTGNNKANVRGIAFDSAGNLYVAANRSGKIYEFTAASSYVTGTAIISGLATDTVNFITIVPEPATLVLLGLGALTLIRRRK